jgi:phosphoenolpyruvate-protein kinase (PTS system EI component)
MADESQANQYEYNFALRIRDIEQNQKLMKQRVLLIGQNLIELQEKSSQELTELKKAVDNLETELTQAKNTLSLISEEISKSARKEEVAILERQFKMFEPLKFARMQDIEKIIDKKISEKSHPENKLKDTFWSNKI